MTIPAFTRKTKQLPQYGDEEIDEFILMLADMKTIYTFEQMGAMLGVAHQSIARWLWGKSKPHKMSVKFCLDNLEKFTPTDTVQLKGGDINHGTDESSNE